MTNSPVVDPTLRPESVVALGVPFKVVYTKMLKKDYGKTDCNDRLISIRAGLTGDTLRSTIIHEWLHAVLHVSGQSEHLSDEQEEALVVTMEHAISYSDWIAPWEIHP